MIHLPLSLSFQIELCILVLVDHLSFILYMYRLFITWVVRLQFQSCTKSMRILIHIYPSLYIVYEINRYVVVLYRYAFVLDIYGWISIIQSQTKSSLRWCLKFNCILAYRFCWLACCNTATVIVIVNCVLALNVENWTEENWIMDMLMKKLAWSEVHHSNIYIAFVVVVVDRLHIRCRSCVFILLNLQ